MLKGEGEVTTNMQLCYYILYATGQRQHYNNVLVIGIA